MRTLRVTDYAARTGMAPHLHDEPSLIVVVGGTYLDRIQGAEVEHRVGRMILCPASVMHSQRFGAQGARKIVFTPPPSSLQYLKEHGVSLDRARYVEAPEISRLSRRLLAERQNHDSFTPLALEGIVLELVAAFARVDRPAASAPPAWLRAARDAVHESSDETVTLERIAASVGKHPVHLAREFRRYFGMSPGAYRRQLRLERAEALLRRHVGLGEVAVACGFAHHSHLCRAFKAAYGMTPSQFRARQEYT